MPTYTYACRKCAHSFDVFHSMTATPKVTCEACGSTRTEKQLGTGAGIIFKGNGFYETDFKEKKGSKPAESKSEKGSSDGESKSKSASNGNGMSENKPKTETKKAPATAK